MSTLPDWKVKTVGDVARASSWDVSRTGQTIDICKFAAPMSILQLCLKGSVFECLMITLRCEQSGGTDMSSWVSGSSSEQQRNPKNARLKLAASMFLSVAGMVPFVNTMLTAFCSFTSGCPVEVVRSWHGCHGCASRRRRLAVVVMCHGMGH